METLNVPVAVVGGGPVGMAVGVCLARHGVRSLIVERNTSITDHPKSRGCTSRSMETFRSWGIEEEIRSGAVGPGGAEGTWVCESITGRLIGTSRMSAPNPHSPCSRSMVAQDVVELALDRLLATEDTSQIRRGAEMVSFDQDAEGVTLLVTDLGTGDLTEVRASYLVACDGAGSTIRSALGIRMIGPDALATLANYYYWADTSRIPQAHRPFIYMVLPDDPAVPSARIAPSGPSAERWLWIHPLESPDQPLLDEAELTRHVRVHWGVPDLEVRLINSMRWRMTAQVPETFQVGRVLLAGDAAHRFPPAGGMGLNSGIQDAVNLGWKLAYVVRGLADPALLHSYEAERRPIAESNNAWSLGNAERLSRSEAIWREGDEEAVRAALDAHSLHQNSEGQGFGRTYDRGAFIGDGRPPATLDPTTHWPSDRPGAWFPHLWLDEEATRSSKDWFDTSFVLVCGRDAEPWRRAAAQLDPGLAQILEVRTLPYLAGPFTFTSTGAVLVRPDGIVAWHAVADGDDHAGALEAALDTVLRGGPGQP